MPCAHCLAQCVSDLSVPIFSKDLRERRKLIDEKKAQHSLNLGKKRRSKVQNYGVHLDQYGGKSRFRNTIIAVGSVSRNAYFHKIYFNNNIRFWEDGMNLEGSGGGKGLWLNCGESSNTSSHTAQASQPWGARTAPGPHGGHLGQATMGSNCDHCWGIFLRHTTIIYCIVWYCLVANNFDLKSSKKKIVRRRKREKHLRQFIPPKC